MYLLHVYNTLLYQCSFQNLFLTNFSNDNGCSEALEIETATLTKQHVIKLVGMTTGAVSLLNVLIDIVLQYMFHRK